MTPTFSVPQSDPLWPRSDHFLFAQMENIAPTLITLCFVQASFHRQPITRLECWYIPEEGRPTFFVLAQDYGSAPSAVLQERMAAARFYFAKCRYLRSLAELEAAQREE